METSNLPGAELKTSVIRMLKELWGSGDELSENTNNEIGNIKMKTENKSKTSQK